MSSQNISTQPTAGPAMQMNIEPESGKQTQGRFQSLRLRGGGAAKGCLIGALSCFICCECMEGCCDCCAAIICCPCEMVCGDDD
ncbi:unnamed protein product [Rhizoctonia solani]|uniref:Uncharacterized protein n=1 Tax=Rhizoctonia solani TaxID=456999 RepID=A0A8H3DGF6_9AGAM|nr:unnamed protein product [Rhizoctonia solani]